MGVIPEISPEATAMLEEVYKSEPPMNEVKEEPKVETEKPSFQKVLKNRDKEYVIDDEEKFTSLAQKGLDYDLQTRLLKQERELFQQEKSKFDQERNKYQGLDYEQIQALKKYDDYLKAHPEEAELVRKELDKLQAAKQENPLWNEVNNLKNELSPIKERLEAVLNEKADHVLNEQFKTLRNSFKEINFDEADENGFTHEHKILDAFSNKTYPSVEAAFKDMYFDKILEMREQKAKENITKEIQDRSKKGHVFVDRLNRPNFVQPKKDIKSQSYDDILKNVIKEHNIGG